MKKIILGLSIVFSGLLMQAQEKTKFNSKIEFFSTRNSNEVTNEESWEYNIIMKDENITIINGNGTGTFHSLDDYEMNVTSFIIKPNTEKIYQTSDCDKKVEFQANEEGPFGGPNGKEVRIVKCYNNESLSTFAYTYESVMIVNHKVVNGYSTVAYTNN